MGEAEEECGEQSVDRRAVFDLTRMVWLVCATVQHLRHGKLKSLVIYDHVETDLERIL